MNNNTLLIVDDHLEWCEALQEEFLQDGGYEVAPPLHNGRDAIDYLEANRPDIIILDLIMPICDGMYVISHIHEKMEEYNPFIYVLSAIGTQKTNRVMRSLDVDYYSVKPISARVVVDNLHKLLADTDPAPAEPLLLVRPERPARQAPPPPPSIQSMIEDFIYELGAPLYRLSTKCTITALSLCLEDEANMNSITALYERTAGQSNPPATSGSIERNIRSTVLKMQKNLTPAFVRCFPYGTGKLTNTEFLHRCVYTLTRRLEELTGEPPRLQKGS